jgi:hypothetical protein
MIPLKVVGEGSTEGAFVAQTLAPHLLRYGVTIEGPIIVTTSRDRTGRKRRGGGMWKQWRADLRAVMRDTRQDVRYTTMFDLYGLPSDFPGLAEHGKQPDTCRRAELLEQSLLQDIGDHRLIPYLQRHEFEALVLCGLDVLDRLLDAHADRRGLESLGASIAGMLPEDIDDGHETAPSKRLGKCLPSYQKALHGPLVVEGTGIARLRQQCPRFDAWIGKLASLGTS